jgi:DNA polymerase
MYHPAAALHQPSLRAVVEKDFAQLPELLEKAHHKKSDGAQEPNDEINDESGPSEPTQLSLF